MNCILKHSDEKKRKPERLRTGDPLWRITVEYFDISGKNRFGGEFHHFENHVQPISVHFCHFDVKDLYVDSRCAHFPLAHLLFLTHCGERGLILVLNKYFDNF